jgi:hypothetical protein
VLAVLKVAVRAAARSTLRLFLHGRSLLADCADSSTIIAHRRQRSTTTTTKAAPRRLENELGDNRSEKSDSFSLE